MNDQKISMRLDYSRHNHDQMIHQLGIECESRRDQIGFIFKTICLSLIVLVSVWVVLVASSTFPISGEIYFVCGLHIAVVAFTLMSSAALVVAHTVSKHLNESLSRRWEEAYRESLLAPEGDEASFAIRIEKLNADVPQLEKKSTRKIRAANRVAWILGTMAVLIFLASLVQDVRTGAKISLDGESEQSDSA